MILSAGLTPAWQYIHLFDQFHVGEVNRAQQVFTCASGKVLNVGIALQHLGAPSITLSVIGGPLQGAIESELADLRVPYRFVRTAASTRTCTTIIDRQAGKVTELVEDGRPLTREELTSFANAYADEAVNASVAVITGSLPVDTPESYYRELVLRTPCPVVLDFRGEGLLSVLDLEPLVIKPNRHELERTVGHSLDTDQALLDAMQTLNDRGAQWVVITDGPRAVWLRSHEECYQLTPPRVDRIVNPIGSGDAMAATIAWAIAAKRTVPDAVRLGMAAAAQNIQELLPCRLNPALLNDSANALDITRQS
jgi:1-phosphofructokinase family hexose kinase